ncbi:hypothetical protein OC846_000973 [Tilletia horrida]|uniref:Ribonuclease n=1 Tax=Tilletia horrida TaxID=155126 RepID=A0AAN6GVZ5_9BASI|nr:hypothetical protein OC846_000973 [Tilletia horrida]
MPDSEAEQDPASISTIPSLLSGPLTRSYTWTSPVPTNARLPSTAEPSSSTTPCLMGIDEAGRGPVLGPMVYAVAYAPISYAAELKSIGFADSKALTPERRDNLLRGLIQNPDNLGWAVRVLSPQDISAGMLRRHPYNLNSQALDATVALIQNVLDSGVDLTEIYVDTLGKAETHAKNLTSHFPRHKHIKWTVTSKADAIYPIVGAASIAAKVTRDRILENWIYREPGLGQVLMPGMADKLGRGEHILGSTVGLLDSGEKAITIEDDDEEDTPANPGRSSAEPSKDADGEAAAATGEVDMDIDIDTKPPGVPEAGPSAGAGKRKRKASTKLLELAEVEADMALRRTVRKTAQIRAATERQLQQKLKENKSAGGTLKEEEARRLVLQGQVIAEESLMGLKQSPNPAFANVGSGYPGDPNTTAFLRATLDPVFGWPGITRFSWQTIRTMLEPPKKGSSSSSSSGGRGGRGGASAGGRGRGRGRGAATSGGRSTRSNGHADWDESGAGDDDDGGAGHSTSVLNPPKHGHAIAWVDEQREAAAAATTSISKFFAPVAKKGPGAASGDNALGSGGDSAAEGPLGRATIARLENAELRRVRVPMWRDLGVTAVGSTAFQL